jgi:hypothetical protein
MNSRNNNNDFRLRHTIGQSRVDISTARPSSHKQSGKASKGKPCLLNICIGKKGATKMCTRESLLEEINNELISRNLKSIGKLGDARKGEIEISGIEEVYEHSKRFFTDVKFKVKFPNGNSGAFTVRFNANGAVSDGAVLVVLINGKFAIVRQWRLPLARWTYEIARGFGENLDKANANGSLAGLNLGDLPLGTLSRELGEELMSGATLTSVTHLGTIAENSGTSAVTPSYFLVQLALDERKLADTFKIEDGAAIRLWDIAQVRKELGRKLCDSHSLTAVALALNYIDQLPR